MVIILIKEFWNILEMASPYLLFGFFISGLIHVLVSPQWIVGLMGKKNWKSVLMASICGVPLPLCSCSVLPTAAVLREKGASRGATASFLISTPETGVDSIVVTYGLMDLPMAVIRPCAAFITAFIAGILVNLTDSRNEEDDKSVQSEALCALDESCCGCSSAKTVEEEPDIKTALEENLQSCCCSTIPPIEYAGSGCSCDSEIKPVKDSGGCCSAAKEVKTLNSKEYSWFIEIFRYAYGSLSNDLAYWLALGFVLSGIISAFIPVTLFDTWIGKGIPSIFLMLLISVPLYICASASTPVAAVLIAKGLSPGAALVLLLAGPATNAGAFPVVGKMLGTKGLFVYLASIIIVTFLFGVGVNAFYTTYNVHPVMHAEHHEMQEGLSLGFISALIMLFLIGKGMWLRPVPKEWKAVKERITG